MDGVVYKRCPRRPFLEHPEFFARAFAHYGAYMNGHLPDPGGTADQSHFYIRVMETMAHAVADADAELAKRRERERLKEEAKARIKGGLR
jgi:hypothetical protein